MVAKLALGAAQLGMKYGRANTNGMPERDEAVGILQSACELGVDLFDTARAYGDSESVIGDAALSGVTISTKLSPLTHLNENYSPEQIKQLVLSDIEASISNLKTEYIDILMLHRWEHRYNDVIWQTLLELKDKNIIKTLGASVSNPKEALEAVADNDIGFIQLPLNLLDWRWEKSGLANVALSSHKHIQARSVLLQGLLVSDASFWPDIDGVNCNEIIEKLDSFVSGFGRSGRADLCYAYVRSLPWVSSVVVGMETMEQLKNNVELFSYNPLDKKQCEIIQKSFNNTVERLLNPSLW